METVTILKSSGITRIGYRAFYEFKSLRSIQIPDGANITTIDTNAFRGCESLQSIHIPNSVTTIAFDAFFGCASLRSLHIPIGVKYIGMNAFYGCKLLQSVVIPDTVNTVGCGAFDGCDTLVHRLTDGANYDYNTITWLRQRFDDLPIHRACYYYANDNDNDNDAESSMNTVDLLSNLLVARGNKNENKNKNKQQALALGATDAMGMTPLHILCCNSHISVGMVQFLVEKDPSLVNLMDVTGSTPLQLFLKCRGLLLIEDMEQQQQQQDEDYNYSLFEEDSSESSNTANIHILQAPTLCNLLERGIKCDDLTIISVLVKTNREIDLRNRDESSGLMPYMMAAVLPKCGLDVVFALAMENLDEIVFFKK